MNQSTQKTAPYGGKSLFVYPFIHSFLITPGIETVSLIICIHYQNVLGLIAFTQIIRTM